MRRGRCPRITWSPTLCASAGGEASPDRHDLVGLLESASIDSLRYVEPATYGLHWFRLIHWAVLAKFELIPEMPDLFDVWAALGVARVRRPGRHA